MRHGFGVSLVAAAALLLGTFGYGRAGDSGNIALPVPKVTIYPGDVVAGELLQERQFVARTVARATIFEARDALVGKVARRTLLPGQPVPVNAIRDPFVIAQGKSAVLVYRSDGLTITSSALVLQNGGVGDLVSVRNADSGVVVKGIVQADGTVRVDAQ